jgi:hypothetical protein
MIFMQIKEIYNDMEIDLFASRLNFQLQRYAAWKPDPNAEFIDAFSVNWANLKFFAFPPFSLIGRCLQKIQEDMAEGVMIIPNWTTRAWYPRLMEMLTDIPRVILMSKKTNISTLIGGTSTLEETETIGLSC